jgi:molecular chaperone HscA
MALRNLREQQVEADRVLIAVQAALDADGTRLLSAEERARIDAALNALQAARAGSDGQRIKQAIADADRETREFATRRMDESVRVALAGHRVDEFRG